MRLLRRFGFEMKRLTISLTHDLKRTKASSICKPPSRRDGRPDVTLFNREDAITHRVSSTLAVRHIGLFVVKESGAAHLNDVARPKL